MNIDEIGMNVHESVKTAKNEIKGAIDLISKIDTNNVQNELRKNMSDPKDLSRCVKNLNFIEEELIQVILLIQDIFVIPYKK